MLVLQYTKHLGRPATPLKEGDVEFDFPNTVDMFVRENFNIPVAFRRMCSTIRSGGGSVCLPPQKPTTSDWIRCDFDFD